MLLLLPYGFGAIALGVDAVEAVERTYPFLGSYTDSGLADWTRQELLEAADDAAKRIATRTGVFVERDTGTALESGTALYSQPERHVSTIHVSHGGATLTPASREQIEALDAAWQGTFADSPRQYFQDGAKIRVYPYPSASASGNLATVYHAYPEDITSESPTIRGPEILGDCLSWAVIAEARKKESDSAMPDVAEFFDTVVGIFEGAAREYWGESQ